MVERFLVKIESSHGFAVRNNKKTFAGSLSAAQVEESENSDHHQKTEDDCEDVKGSVRIASIEFVFVNHAY